MNKLTILHEDATKLSLPSNSVDLIITHPPYIGVDTVRYGGESKSQINSSQDLNTMLKLLKKATKEMYRVLKPNGHLIIANGKNENLDMRYVIDVEDDSKFLYADFTIQNSYEFDDFSKVEKMVTESITTWYHFVKGDQSYYNPYMVRKWNMPVWNLPFNNMDDPIDEELSKKYHVVDAMNKQIPERLIQMFSKPGHVVLDPFGGSGLVAVTAVELGRYGITNDISEDQVNSAKQRARLTLGS